MYVEARLSAGGMFFYVFRAAPLFLVGVAVWRRGVERIDVVAQIVRHVGETVAGQAVEQLGVRLVRQGVLPVGARLAGVEVGVRQVQAAAAERVERRLVALAGPLEALEKQRLSLFRRRLELQRLERADLRQQPIEEGQEAREQSGLLVVGAVGLLVF